MPVKKLLNEEGKLKKSGSHSSLGSGLNDSFQSLKRDTKHSNRPKMKSSKSQSSGFIKHP